MTERALLERNLRLYAWHQPLSHSLFWGPVFFLFFSERFPVEQVLLLGSIYYASVVVLEVPSGYFSDRVSRVATLRISNAAMAAAFALFAAGGASFPAFAAAQGVLALGFAFRSGTDTSFHFDTLAALGREVEFGAREARIQRNSYLVIAASAIAGGGVAVLDLRLAYAVQVAFTAGALGIAFAFREPPRSEGGFAHASFFAQLRDCARFARTPFLAWIFVYVFWMTTTEHIPWQFGQPYLAAVFGESIQAVERTPIATGLLHAGIAFGGALAAGLSIRLRERLGVGATLLAVTGLQTVLIAAMAAAVHPLIAGMIALRSVQPAVSAVVVSAAIVPRVPQRLRATYQSLHSFAGRLGFAGVLWFLSGLGEPGAVADRATIAEMLRASAWIAIAGLVLLVSTARALREPEAAQANSASRTG